MWATVGFPTGPRSACTSTCASLLLNTGGATRRLRSLRLHPVHLEAAPGMTGMVWTAMQLADHTMPRVHWRLTAASP